MSSFRGVVALGCVCGVGLLIAGCSHQPDRVEAPPFDPTAAAKKALEMYDTDHDGVLSESELEKCPALKSAAKRYSVNGDGKVTADGIAARVAKWNEQKTAVYATPVTVRLNGQPLEGATVTLEPEPFLVQGNNLVPVTGKTNGRGECLPKLAGQEHPGVPPALYKVRISKLVDGKESLAPRYNTNTTLGVEIAPDNLQIKGALRYDLTSK